MPVFLVLSLFSYANGGIPYNYVKNGTAKISLANDKDLILEKEVRSKFKIHKISI